MARNNTYILWLHLVKVRRSLGTASSDFGSPDESRRLAGHQGGRTVAPSASPMASGSGRIGETRFSRYHRKMADDARRPTRPLIFISHVHRDGDAASQLQGWLDEAFDGGLDFFNTSDPETLAPGAHWLQVIERGLASASMLLAVFSSAGLRSLWVNFECGAAWLRRARVVPLCAPPIDKSHLPPPYSHLQSLNLADTDDLRSLVGIIAKHLGRRPPSGELGPVKERLVAALSGDADDPIASSTPGGVRIEYLEIEWKFRRSEVERDAWAASYHRVTRFEVLSHEKERHPIEFSKSVDLVPFRRERPPRIEMKGERTSPGQVRVGAPFRSEGPAFAFNIYFDPPLLRGDLVGLDVHVDFPAYKIGIKDILVQTLMAAGDAVRDFDYTSRAILDPTERFIYRVVLPKQLGATPLPPSVTYRNAAYPEETEFVRRTPGVFTVVESDVQGEPCWVMTLDRRRPPERAAYRMRWRLPARRDL
jgi:hypothetical protein